MIPAFFIDTANITEIKSIWEKLSDGGVSSKSIRGITTNPNALNKVSCHSLKEFEVLIDGLVSFMEDIVGKGTIYVQIPNSLATHDEYKSWAHYISQLVTDRIEIGLKIPPYEDIIKLAVEELYYIREINVTGIADAATALRCLSYPQISYVSIIPGRMEEVGINSALHLNLLNQRYKQNTGEVIAGSMRTIDGLKSAIKYNTIPTIGTRVWNQMTADDYKNFNSWWNTTEDIVSDKLPAYVYDIPFINNLNKNLTHDFFIQMDTLGKSLYSDFKSNIHIIQPT